MTPGNYFDVWIQNDTIVKVLHWIFFQDISICIAVLRSLFLNENLTKMCLKFTSFPLESNKPALYIPTLQQYTTATSGFLSAGIIQLAEDSVFNKPVSSANSNPLLLQIDFILNSAFGQLGLQLDIIRTSGKV